MTTENKSNALAQYGPIGAPVLGIVLAIVFIVAALMTSSVSDTKGQLQTRIGDISRKLQNPEPTQEIPGVPLTDSVVDAMEPDENAPSTDTPAGLNNVINLPMVFAVSMEKPPLDTFAEFDDNQDGFWSEDEWRNSTVYPDPAFEKWDRDADGYISETEFNEGPPVDEETKFKNTLDKDGNGFLEVETGETTSEDVERADRYPYDGKISLEEYLNRYEPNPAREYGAVANVSAKTDYEKLEIVVTWDEPGVGNLPDDVNYIIERRAPETVQKRRSEYAKRMGEYRERLREWEEQNFEPWYNQLSSDYKSQNGITTRLKAQQHFEDVDFEGWWKSAGNAYKEDLGIEVAPDDASAEEKAQINAAAKEAAEGDVWPQIERKAPVAPPPISEWEVVATGVSGTEYRDSSFDMDVTYTYAVRMESDAPPVRAHVKLVNDDPATAFGSGKGFAYHERTVSEAHPVRVQNRITLAYRGSSGAENVDLILETWVPIGDGGAREWYRAQVEVNVNSEDDVGDSYSRREILDNKGKLLSASGDELNAGELLPEDVEVDFDTGFRFIVYQGGEVLLSHDEWPQFALPRETAQAAGPQGSAQGMDNPVEVRAMTVNSDGKSAHFELTRWHQLENGDWVRVVAEQTVDNGDDIGMSVNLSSPGKGVRIYDSAGEQISRADGTVDLSVGAFEGLEGRTLTIGGEEIDLFATLYKE